MSLDVVDSDDPLKLFGDGFNDACIGEWANEHLQVRIEVQGNRMVLQSAKKELVLTSGGFNEWSVADDADPLMTVYDARITGYGRDTRLTLRPPKHKGSDKKAVLRRLEHLRMEEISGGPPALEDKRSGAAAGQPRAESPDGVLGMPLAIRDRDEAQEHRKRRRQSGGGRRQGRSRSLECSHSPGRRGDPRDDTGGEVTTLFVTGLPSDVREEEVRASLARHGSILRVVMMRRGQGECNAFVRFDTLKEAKRALDKILDGRAEVCGARVKAEMARRNSN